MNNFGVFQLLINGNSSLLTEIYLDQKSRSLFKRTHEDLKTWDYFLDKNTENGTERIQVCRNVFYKTLQVKEKFVRYTLQASEMGAAKKDQQGTHAPKQKISQPEQKVIQDHINMFLNIESHYIRKEGKKMFIADTFNFNKLTITRMYELYREMCLTNET